MNSALQISDNGGAGEAPSEQHQRSIVSGLGCHSGKGSEQDQLSISTGDKVNHHLFALIIGIIEYQDPDIRKLKGCIHDSENFARFLTESIHANPLHIKHLRNAEATREGILSAFREHFIENENIQRNDTMVFYFAGHGSEEILAGSGNKMETICPYDDRMQGVRGIPDRTFDALTRQLAAAKGDNMTAIFDSCHSGGMGRLADTEDSRYLPPPDSPFPEGLDQDIWTHSANISYSRLATEVQDPYRLYPDLKAHVLLAACQHDEFAYEEPIEKDGHHAGAFTTLLLELLRHPERTLSETTYIGLFHTLQQPENKLRLKKQTPYVEGNNKTRILFSTKDIGSQFTVSQYRDGTFSVTAGAIHGVDTDTEFAVISGKDRFQPLKPSKVLALSCTFEKPDDKILKPEAKAEVTKWNQPHLKVFIHEAQNVGYDSDPNYLAADIAIRSLENGGMELERRDAILPCYAQRIISINAAERITTPNTPEETSAIMTAISRFTFHLLHRNKSSFIGDKLRTKLELQRWAKFGYGNSQDFFSSGERLKPAVLVNVSTESNITSTAKITDFSSAFCLTISIRDYDTPLFPYVFAFDAATYEIDCFYHPEPTKVGPLRQNQVVSVGYGDHGGDPFEFQPNEVIFFKVFVTSKYVDMHCLKQKSPFSQDGRRKAGRAKEPTIFGEFWESWTYVVES